MSEPKLIKTWQDLKGCKSDTHYIELDEGEHCGWIHSKNGDDDTFRYLSTHTFYGSSHKMYTQMLQDCGFNVVLANWDEKGA